MAVEVARYFGRRKRKRRSGNEKRKLRVNERVEVRSVEDGLLGSWHPGTVILCEKMKRHVRYDNVLDDDGLDFLTELVVVPDVLDGVSSSTCNQCGYIRPVPPFLEFGTELQYGLCVDANYQEAWWEGVIFDHDDGMQERRIFFPDLGDEMKIGIDQLRITQDWDEVTENWERRGNWVFLELVEECEQSSYIAVSLKQIWYDMQAKKDFIKIKDWTSKAKNLWRDLVMEIIGDYFTLTLKELIPVLEISNGSLEKALETESVELTTDVHHDTSPNNISGSYIKHVASPKEKGHSPTVLDTDPNQESTAPIQERYGMHLLGGVQDLCIEEALKISCSEKEVLPQDEPVPPVEEKLPQNPENISRYDSGATGEVVSGSGGVPILYMEEALKISCSEKEVLPQDEPVPAMEEELPQNPESISCYDSGATGEVVGVGGVPILRIEEALKISCPEKEVLPQDESVPPIEEKLPQNPENISRNVSGATGEDVSGLGGVPILCIEEAIKISFPEKEVLPQEESVPPIEEKLHQNLENISCYDSGTTVEVVSGLSGVPILHIEEALKISCSEKEVLLQDESMPPVEEKLPQNPENISCYDSGAIGEVVFGLGGVPILRIEEALKNSCAEKEVLPQDESVPPIEENISCYDSGAAGEVISGSRGYAKSRKFKQGMRSVLWELLKLPGAEFYPDAVNEYVAARQRKTKELMKTKVRKHLAFLGWKIEFREKKTFYNQRQYKYTSPGDEKCYMSLDQVCKHLKNETSMNSLPSKDSHRMMHPSPDSSISHLHLEQPENSWDPDDFPMVVPPPPVEVNVNTECFPQAVVEYYMMASNQSLKAVKKTVILKAKEQLLSAGWIISYGCKTRKQLTYTSPKQRTYHSLLRACGDYIKESISNLNISALKPSDALGINEGSIGSDNLLHRLLQKEPELLTGNGKWKQKRLKHLKASLPKVEEKDLPSWVLRSTKRMQKVHAPSLSHQKTLNVLSWLIDSKVVLPRVKVYYQAIGKPRSEREGRITSYGLKCNCCLKTYSLRGFEGHASGSISRRPAVSIFLEDGRSLLDIQMQIMHDYQKRESLANPSSDWHQCENDGICSVCHYGGDLILCDQCPSSFHGDCLGLEDIPDGDWFCPSCQCGICGQSKFEGIDDGNFLTCSQCERKYHLWCLGNRGMHKSGRHGKNWFCSKNCKMIYAGLQQLLGQPVVVGENNLKWTLLKWVNSDNCHLSNNNNYLAESYCKLNVALGLMHECFETLKEPDSKRDLIEDVLFSRWSKLKRLNFQGFYTVLLEREDELISVATLRVYGEKVAEVPLVGTRVQYRRRGMCRVLMNELEKVLKQLGVERLVLPSAHVTLDTWINYFGFTKMTNSERKQFLDCTFLDFQQAIMCQKLLTKIPSRDIVPSKETKQKSHDILSVNKNIDFDGSSSLSDVHQAEDMKVSRIPDPQLVEYVSPLRSF
ncbi:hypothetical protein L6164_026013 [Bauhinia variegata]|uniref:Uncharacterized protein n=1 Tax=Bauhinia variegata TaxID=167791 RepID=A0ACB9M280_BAUVA|nr:hypothetical protein L6164_026013 [Bauhinia variegata]